MVSNNIFSFLKGNVGEEDVIKVLLGSAVKSLISVAIIIGAILSYFTLCSKYGYEFVSILIILVSIFSLWYYLRGIGECIDLNDGEFRWYKYKTWNLAFDNLHFDKLLYIDESNKSFEIAWMCFESVIAGICLTGISYIFGYILLNIYAYIISLSIYIYFPTESLIIISLICLSTLFMSILFLRLKWKKIRANGSFNINLAAWCVCAAVIITMIAFIAGVAIRRIAGFIGIEYTVILVISYILVTVVYVYLDLKQWLDNKERERIRIETENQKKLDETITNP